MHLLPQLKRDAADWEGAGNHATPIGWNMAESYAFKQIQVTLKQQAIMQEMWKIKNDWKFQL